MISYSPQSTLKKDLVPWEKRFNRGRQQDWSGRYQDAAEHTKHASKVYLCYDPYEPGDKAHADRFSGDNIVHLHSNYVGHKTVVFLRRAGVLKEVTSLCIANKMDYPEFAMRQANLLRRKKRRDEAEALSAACLAETGWLDPFIVEHIRAALTYREPYEYLPRLEKLAAEGGSLRRVHNIIAHLKYRLGEMDEALDYAANNVDFKLFEIRLLAEIGRSEEAREQLANVTTLPRHQKSLADIDNALAGNGSSQRAAGGS